MKRNGFTLVELLAVIALLAIIGVVAGGIVIGSFGGTKEDINEIQEKMIISAAKAYVVDNLDICGSGCEIDLFTLVSNGYIDETDSVTGSIIVTKSGQKYIYASNLRVSVGNTLVRNFTYTGSVQEITLSAGTYKLEVWGAQGGDEKKYMNGKGGKGGYAKGTITLNESTNLYIYVGGAGDSKIGTTTIDGGFNGGGAGYTGSNNKSYVGSGGGATDIRISTDSLYSRVIVAGGGGGAGSWQDAYPSTGGYGGGETGGSASNNAGNVGSGGTQIAAGTNAANNAAGGFGVGGSLTSGTSGGGGGGGWYGGGSGNRNGAGGGGGSGYVYISSTSSNYPSGCLLNSSYYLTSTENKAGNQSFADPDGATVTGHSGNGYARITKQ